MPSRLTRAIARLIETRRHRRELESLSRLPDHLLRDMDLTRLTLLYLYRNPPR